MRLWSLHPKVLDRQGLLACWRESLLAQKVLRGETRGYRNHPQLLRFRAAPDPLAAIAGYLSALADEAERRGYSFDRAKIGPGRPQRQIPLHRGQLAYEWEHLKRKLARRDPERLDELERIAFPDPHPLFEIVDGGIADWERPSGN
ncbi:MAG TPA: pyrimidine dimer DNA glycosylase/endonuclease V [Anaerolineales bacterium]|nr:pyrimidine dimer DNA glycosylase/endonuclease V [Anaerolineales bacterium]